MKTTGNLGLKKPEGTDLVDIADLNGNMDILDNAVTGKVDKVTGKQLSTNDYTAAEKTKLAGIATGANNYTHPNHTGDVTSTGDGVTAIAAGVIVDADVNANAGIKFSKINAAGSIMDSDINDEAYINMLKIGTGKINNATLDQLYGVTSPIQDQLNARPKQTTGDITYYVRTDGSDSNTGQVNTAAGAFKTIARAISAIPQVVNHNVTINVAAGTYPEQVTIAGFSGSGVITLNGDSVTSTSRIINVLTIYRNSVQITAKGFNITSTTVTNLYVEGCTNVILQYLNIVSAATTIIGIQAHSSKVYVNSCVISNKAAALHALINGEIVSEANTGTGNANAANAGAGGKISLIGSKPSGTNVTSGGGTIFDSASGVINPWGDNTQNNRPIVWATMSANMTLTAGTWNVIKYNVGHTNQFGGLNTTTGTFTAPQTGWYSIKAQGLVVSMPAGKQVQLRILHGTNGWSVDVRYAIGGENIIYNGSIMLMLQAGEVVLPQVYVDAQVVLSTGMDTTRLEIVRVA